MMKMVDMKMSDQERSDAMPAKVTEKDKGPKYPYGLNLNLETEALDKMGIDLNDFNKGDEVMIQAKCYVSRKEESVGEGDSKPRKSMSLQITKMCFAEGMDEEEGDEIGWDEEGREGKKIDKRLKEKGY